VGVTYINRKQ